MKVLTKVKKKEKEPSSSKQKKETMDTPLAENKGRRFDLNYIISKYFIENSRLTILALFLLIALGVGSILSLKTTGFPNPEIKVAIVSTFYQGASSETVVKDITRPLENVVKGVEGVEGYTSTSRNSVSVLSVEIEQDANTDIVISRLDSAIGAINLPDGVNKPRIFTPSIGGSDYVFSITADNNKTLYEVKEDFIAIVESIDATSEVDEDVELEKAIEITLNEDKLEETGIAVDDIISRINSYGNEFPVATNVKVGGNLASINVSTSETNLDKLRNIEISQSGNGFQASQPAAGNPNSPSLQQPQTLVKLSDLANVDFVYEFEGSPALFGVALENEEIVTPTVGLTVKTVENTAQNAYYEEIVEKTKDLENVNFITLENVTKDYKKGEVNIVTNYSVDNENQEQVDEVLGGLIGAPLAGVDGPIANIGWILGGIQLVFLVMLAFVSWRAAIVASISIPLSLIFSTIYVWMIGESLNTLVLFSLVLVLGLVVDPALVIMEAIQRKLDTGLSNREAVLAAVKAVGPGVFMASLTNIIVFTPFGVLSGVLGQIFAYIPLTIIPATIGSYIVPLIFLAWIGGLILRPTKSQPGSEEENLWPIAKWLIAFNTKVLHSPRWVRLLIIITGLVVPFGIVFGLTATEQVRSADFASDDNADFIIIGAEYLPKLDLEAREKAALEVIEIATKTESVRQVLPFGVSDNGFNYFIELESALDRDTKSSDLVEELNNTFQEEYTDTFFDIQAALDSNGPPQGNYQVSMSVETENLSLLETASLDLAETLKKVCKNTESLEIRIDAECNGDNDEFIVIKVDDGYTNRDNTVLNIEIDEAKLKNNASFLDISSAQFLVLNQIRKEYEQFENPGQDVEVAFTDGVFNVDFKVTGDPDKSKAEIEALAIPVGPTSVAINDIANVKEEVAKQSILRVEGKTTSVVEARLNTANATNQQVNARIVELVKEYYAENDGERLEALGLEEGDIDTYSEGGAAGFARTFQELLIALVLAIFSSYLVLALFFKSLAQPLAILYTIPLTLMGVYPALAYLGGGQIGFLEIIGLIILVGIVENVAIFLVDLANAKIAEDGWEPKRAIAYASGIRFRSVILTKFTALASLAPLAVFSIFYRSIALTIIFGLLASGFLSLITSPILFIFFKWLSETFRSQKPLDKTLFLAPLTVFPVLALLIVILSAIFGFESALFFGIAFLFSILVSFIYIIIWGIKDRPHKKMKVAAK